MLVLTWRRESESACSLPVVVLAGAECGRFGELGSSLLADACRCRRDAAAAAAALGVQSGGGAGEALARLLARRPEQPLRHEHVVLRGARPARESGGTDNSDDEQTTQGESGDGWTDTTTAF